MVGRLICVSHANPIVSSRSKSFKKYVCTKNVPIHAVQPSLGRLARAMQLKMGCAQQQQLIIRCRKISRHATMCCNWFLNFFFLVCFIFIVRHQQGNVLQHNVSAGVIISETSLVLQRVSRHAAGRYTCHASNQEGEGSSLPYQLNVARKFIHSLHFFLFSSCHQSASSLLPLPSSMCSNTILASIHLPVPRESGHVAAVDR